MRVGHALFFQSSGWCFQEDLLTGCSRGGPGAARCLTHAGQGGSSFCRLSVLFLFCSVYSCYLSQLTFVTG